MCWSSRSAARGAATASSTASLSGIPYASYNLYVYMADSNSGSYDEQVSLGGKTYYYSPTNVANFMQITNTAPGTFPIGNYVLATGMTGSTQTIQSGTAQQEGSLCGFEIVNTVVVPGTNLLPATTSLSIASGGTLDLGGGSQQVASLSDKPSGSGGSIINSGTAASS